MQDQAIGHDSSNASPDRWSVWAYAITGLGLAGIVVAILLLATGRSDAADYVAILSFGVVAMHEGFAAAHGRTTASDGDGSVESMRAAGLGWLAPLVFLAVCYLVTTLPLAPNAPVVFSQSGLSATFWIVLAMTQSVPRAYRIWRMSPPAAQD